MSYALAIKPPPGTPINWMKAPASLAGCQPFIYGEDPVTTLEYVSHTPTDPGTFLPNAAGVTTWHSWGINMNGGGVVGAYGVQMPSAIKNSMDQHRRTIAWAQRFYGDGAVYTSCLHNGIPYPGAGAFAVAASTRTVDDPVIWIGIAGDVTTVNASSTLVNEWHALMISWSDGLGTDTRKGLSVWDNGALIYHKDTYTGIGLPDPAGSYDVAMAGTPNAANSDFEYWYEFNEYIPSGTDLAGKLFADGYYFFRYPRPSGCGAAFTVNPCPEDC